MVNLGEKITASCDYSYDPSEAISSIGWQIGEMHGFLTPVASYSPFLPETLSYTHANYQPPAYNMTVESLGPGEGRSTFVIQKINWTDAGKFWCTVSVSFDSYDVDFVSLIISGKPRQMQYNCDILEVKLTLLRGYCTPGLFFFFEDLVYFLQ